MYRFFIMTALFLTFNAVLFATTTVTVNVTCPVCGTVDTAEEISTTNTFGGTDSDFLQRARGADPVTICPITCTNCYYSGFISDFGEDIKLEDEVIRKIKDKKALKPAMKMTPGDEPCAWVKYDLIIQTMELTGEDKKSDMVRMNQMGAWAVRLECDTYAKFDDKTKEKYLEWPENNLKEFISTIKGFSEIENDAIQEVKLGMALHEHAKKTNGEDKKSILLCAAQLLRKHGENSTVLEIVAELKPLMTPEEFKIYAEYINEWIGYEQKFQKKALAIAEEKLKTEMNDDKKMILTYIAGDINRRLGNKDKAGSLISEALNMNAAPQGLKDFVKEWQDTLGTK